MLGKALTNLVVDLRNDALNRAEDSLVVLLLGAQNGDVLSAHTAWQKIIRLIVGEQ